MFSLKRVRPCLSRRSKITCNKSSRRDPLLSLASTTWFTIARNFLSISFETKLARDRETSAFSFVAWSWSDLRNVQKLIHEWQEKVDLMFESIPKRWLKDVVAHFTKLSVWVCKTFTVESKGNSGHNLRKFTERHQTWGSLRTLREEL